MTVVRIAESAPCSRSSPRASIQIVIVHPDTRYLLYSSPTALLHSLCEVALAEMMLGVYGYQQPSQLECVHTPCSFLRELSDQLAANWVPVVAVQGSPIEPAELRQAAAAAGCADLAAFLWLQSLREAFHMQPREPDAQLVGDDRLSWTLRMITVKKPTVCHKGGCPAHVSLLQALQDMMEAWAQVIGDQGLISVELSAFGAAHFPQAAVCELYGAWRAFSAPLGARELPPREVLAAAAAAGLVPRPRSGLRFSRSGVSRFAYVTHQALLVALCWTRPCSQRSVLARRCQWGESLLFRAQKWCGSRSNAAWTLSHLDKVPLTIRGAGPDHLPALMHLQLTAAPSLQVCFSLPTGILSISF